MKRRDFFAKTAIAYAGVQFLFPNIIGSEYGNIDSLHHWDRKKKPKNIIFMVSDGMSMGTLTMSDLFQQKKSGQGCHWLNLYGNNKVSRGLMDMASASSMVTDSAAASSSWGGGCRVKNGRLNLGENGEEYLPIWQKFKRAGKKVGCVTTVPITHATPAGFCVVHKTRDEQTEIAKKYLDLKFDVMMGGGKKYFEDKDKNINLIEDFKMKGYDIVQTTKEMALLSGKKPVLGIFGQNGLPYELDRLNVPELKEKVPSLGEMTKKAIDLLKDHDKGFCLQVEGGKVDWAAHANDTLGMIYDQLAFDDALKVAIDFAEKEKNTLVVITTDHGNANPGLIYGKNADKNFESLLQSKHTTSYILHDVNIGENYLSFKERVEAYQGYKITDDEAKSLLATYDNQPKSDDFNDYKLPFELYAQIMKPQTSVFYCGTEHTADYVELAMFGPGSQYLKPFIKNVDLHYYLLEVAEVENKF